eukprot:gene10180-18850_t
MNLEVISKDPQNDSNGVSPNGNSKHVSNGSRFLPVNNKPKKARLSQPRPSVWTLKDVQKVFPKEAFDYFILLTILFNCIVLIFDAPLPENDKSQMNEVAEKIEYYFLVIFLFEAIVKIVAMGFVLHPRAYLRSGWNILDFTVVVVGVVILILSSSKDGNASNINIKSLRAIRVLRPLKLISGIPRENPKTPCDPNLNKTVFVYGKRCPKGFECKRGWTGPNSGITSFDNIFLSMLTVFQCITMEGWTDIMYNTFYAIDEHGYMYSFLFIALIVIGSFFMLNLFLGVLSGEFAKEREKVENRRSFLKLRQSKQVERQYDCYMEWILKGEEILAQEVSQESNSSPKESTEKIADAALNPAIVFTANRYTFNSSTSHRKSKFARIKEQMKISRIKIRYFVKHGAFYWSVLMMVFLNTCIVATNHYDQPRWLTDFQRVSEIFFVTIFTAEMLLKLYGLGPKQYFHSMFNVFDCVVVNLSILEIVIVNFSNDFDLGLSVMRSLRLLRIFKVTKYWSSLRNLISSLMNGMKSILSLIFLLFLFIVISALLGMQLFGGRFEKLEEYPRTNFDTFVDSLMAVFQIMTGEDWNAVMYNGVNAYGGPKKTEGLVMSLYFVLLVIFGNYTLLNVFLAIAVDNLTNAEILSQDEEDEQKLLTRQRTARAGFTGPGTHWTKLKALSFVRTLQRQVEEEENRANMEKSVLANNLVSNEGEKVEKDNKNMMEKRVNPVSAEIQRKWNKILQQQSSVPLVVENYVAVNEDQNKNIENNSLARSNTNAVANGDVSDQCDNVEKMIREDGLLNVMKTNVADRRRVQKQNPAFREVSMFIFTQENPIRRFCHAIVHHRFFDPFIMGVIFVSSLTLAIEDPLNDESKINQVLKYFDYVFAAIFSLEVILKFIDIGLFLHKGAYFRDFWNILDFFVVACNIASIVVSLQSADSRTKTSQTVKALRVLRVLRPLKAISKIKKLKAVFQCMIFSLKNVAFVLIITMFFLFIFACIGVQLFKGKFFHCTDTSKMTKEDCKGDFYWFPSKESVVDNKPTVKKREWKHYDFHFDNVFHAMITLYASSTGEGWPGAMHRTIDATKIDQGPITNSNPQLCIYFIVFVIVFTFMIINIYVALIILTFQRQGERELTEGGLDRNQRDCIHFALTAKAKHRYMPKDKHSFSYRVWYVVDSRPFEYCIMLFIVLNTIQLMMRVNPRSFLDPSMFRLCRAARIIKLLRSGTSIRLMLWTFLQSFKALPYVTALILLLFYMYAVIGMQVFSKIKYGDVITEYNNFRTIIQALQVLFRSATGEGWNSIMRACYDEAPCEVTSGSNTTCGSTFMAIFYFTTFIFFCMFLMLNLFVAVIMDNFEYLTRDSSILGPHHLDEFVRVWSEYDPTASERLHHQMLYTFMCHMAPPVGFGKKCPKSLGYKRLIRMNMPVGGDQTVTFHATLFALIRTSLDIKMKGNMFKNDQQLRRSIQLIWPNMPEKNIEKILPKQTAASSQQMTVGKIYCVKLLVTNYRATKAKEEVVSQKDEPQGTPSVFKRIITSFRRKGSKRNSKDEERIELRSRPQEDLQRSRTFSFKRSDSKSADGQLTREGRRRSSWHDLGSFFRQKEGASLEAGDPKVNSTDAVDANNKPQGSQAQSTVIQNRNATGRGQGISNHKGTARAFSSGATAGSTASQLGPGGRQQMGSYRHADVNRNGMVRFSNNRDQQHRGVGSRSQTSGYTGGKPVTRSYSAGAADYQKSNIHQYRHDPRGIASPNYNRNPTAVARQQHSNSVANANPHSSMIGLSKSNSVSQHSIHSLPNLYPASSATTMAGSQATTQTRSAPVSMDVINSNDYRSHTVPVHNKPNPQVWHSGPPFYGPPNTADPPKIQQNSRPGPAPRNSAPYGPVSQMQPGYAQSQQGIRQGTARAPMVSSNDMQYSQRSADQSRLNNQQNAALASRLAADPNSSHINSNRKGVPNAKLPFEDEEEILDGRQTQQYYDQMIAQINDKIAKAVERGQSPYAVYAANDDEESDWC